MQTRIMAKELSVVTRYSESRSQVNRITFQNINKEDKSPMLLIPQKQPLDFKSDSSPLLPKSSFNKKTKKEANEFILSKAEHLKLVLNSRPEYFLKLAGETYVKNAKLHKNKLK